MPEQFAFYSQTYDQLPDERLRELSGQAQFTIRQGQDGSRAFVYQWPGLTVTCNEMLAKEVPEHLDGFCGYVMQLYGGKLDRRGTQVLDRINHTRLVVGIVIDPARDDRAEDLVGAMCNGLDALMFFEGALYDQEARLILGPDGSFDERADILGPVAGMIKNRVQVELNPEWRFQPTEAQRSRYDQALAELRQRKVPTLSYAL